MFAAGRGSNITVTAKSHGINDTTSTLIEVVPMVCVAASWVVAVWFAPVWSTLLPFCQVYELMRKERMSHSAMFSPA